MMAAVDLITQVHNDEDEPHEQPLDPGVIVERPQILALVTTVAAATHYGNGFMDWVPKALSSFCFLD
ncbi:unnamed protein product [Leptosia nina]|uniref:Uncharacterized protein n=1 Tax=Leptosia nina TaxID=320188 RepID=A0AAV1JI11_9NEOP